MKREQEREAGKQRVKEMSFALGPPVAGGWSASFEEESDPASQRESTSGEVGEVAGQRGGGAGVKGRVTLDAAGEQFGTRLQLLLTYRREVASVASATSFTNIVSLLALLSEMAAASRGRDESDALASVRFDLTFEDENGEERRYVAKGPIYERHHYKAVEDRGRYHDAALRLLYETTVQQLMNSYERLIGDIARAHIFESNWLPGRFSTRGGLSKPRGETSKDRGG